MKNILFIPIFVSIIIMTFFYLSLIYNPPISESNLNNSSEKLSFSTSEYEFSDQAKQIEKGTTLYDILNEENFTSHQITTILETINKRRIKLNLIPSNRYEIINDLIAKMKIIIIEISQNNLFIIEIDRDDIRLHFQSNPLPLSYAVIKSKIKDNLFDTLSNMGYYDSFAYQLYSIFMCDVDFNTDIRNGDEISAIVEQQQVKRSKIKVNRIIGAQIILRNSSFVAIGFYNTSEHFSYYDPKGFNLKKAFLNSPIKYGRITSRFQLRRYHPILKIFRPHLGIDYAAPVGTSVISTAEGVVSDKGWDKKGGGNYLKIRHKNGYSTTYMHLQGYHKTILLNKPIKQGQIIGYVGTTGISTGPHLDYRITLNSKYINPLAMTNPSIGPLSATLHKYFFDHRDKVLSLLNQNINYEDYIIVELKDNFKK